MNIKKVDTRKWKKEDYIDSNISAILRGKSWKQVNSSTTIPEGSTSK